MGVDIGQLSVCRDAQLTIATSSAGGGIVALAPNPGAKMRMVFNDSPNVLFLKLGSPAASNNYTVQIAALGYYEFPRPVYTGSVCAAWAAASGSGYFTELV